MWVRLVIAYLHIVLFHYFGFYENRLSESHMLQSDVSEFMPLLLTFIAHFWLKFVVTDLLIMLFNIYDVHENLQKGGHITD